MLWTETRRVTERLSAKGVCDGKLEKKLKTKYGTVSIPEWAWRIGELQYYPCLHFEFWSGGKSSSPPYELSFGGDEL